MGQEVEEDENELKEVKQDKAAVEEQEVEE